MSWPTYLKDSSGNQIFAGGTIASDTLWLSSTGHATKGLIKFGALSAYDEVNTRLGINTLAPSVGLEIASAVAKISGSLTSVVALDIEPTMRAGVDNPKMVFAGGSFDPSINLATASGLYFSGTFGSLTDGKTITDASAVVANPVTGVGGAITNLKGLWVIPNIGTLKPTNSYGVYISDVGSSSVTNAYGLYITAPTGATNKYGAIIRGPAAVGTDAPSNVTDGDLTAIRGHFGTNAAFTTGMSFEVNAGLFYQGGTISTQSFTPVYGAQFTPTFTGALVDLVGVGINPTFRPANNPPTWVMGVRSLPLVDPPNAVTIPGAYGWALGLTTGSTAGGAITNLTGVLVSVSYGTQKPTNATGIAIPNVGSAGITTAIALDLGLPTGSTNNYYMHFDTNNAAALVAYQGKLAVIVGGVAGFIPWYT